MIHLDTHVAIWLRTGDSKRLKPVMRIIEREEVALSPFVVLELQALFEIGRLRETGRWISEALEQDYGIAITTGGIERAGDRALDLSFTRDPYDRLIAGHALAANATLLTEDEVLRANVSCARWA